MSREKDWSVVKYHNDFAMRPWGELTAFQQDILACLLVTLRERNVTEIHLSVEKLETLMQRRIKRDRISEQIKRMNGVITSIKAEYEDEHIEGELVVFPGVWREKETGDVVVDVHPKYLRYFNNLSANYLKWDLSEHIALPTVYSKTLYRYLSSFGTKGWWYVSVDELRERMLVPDKYDTRRMMDNVIMPAVNTLRETLPDKFADLKVERIKKGSRIIAFKFTFTPLAEDAKMLTTFDDIEDEPW